MPKKIRRCGHWWWLRSPGYFGSNAALVITYGSVNEYGASVFNVSGAVRPALQIANLKSSNLQIGDIFNIGRYEFIIISDSLALSTDLLTDDFDEIIGIAFREDNEVDDSNDYESSDIKKYVDEWFEKLMKEN